MFKKTAYNWRNAKAAAKSDGNKNGRAGHRRKRLMGKV
jgi:hypothetical protein